MGTKVDPTRLVAVTVALLDDPLLDDVAGRLAVPVYPTGTAAATQVSTAAVRNDSMDTSIGSSNGKTER